MLHLSGIELSVLGQEILFVDDILVTEMRPIGITGPSGCGKTTLLRAIAGHVPNHVKINGSIRNDFAVQKMSYIPQKGGLFPWFTVFANASIMSTGHPSNLNVDCWKTVFSALFVNQLADKYPHELSGGEYDRVLIACHVLSQSDVYLIDEPASNLDIANKINACKLLRAHIADKLAVIVSHDLTVLSQLCDDVYLFSIVKGVAIQSGHLKLTMKNGVRDSKTFMDELMSQIHSQK